MSKNYIKYEQIIENLNIKKGDSLLLIADLTNILIDCKNNNEKFDGNKFIDSIIKKIGLKGTLLLPTFNFDFCKGKDFDYINTVPKTGALPKIGLSRKDFKRTKHPIHSFAVWGSGKEELCNLDNLSSFGNDSPFSYLHKKNVKNLTIGLDYKLGFTMVHYCEEKVGVNYRLLKEFKGFYIDKNKKRELKTYKMYVRKDVQLNTMTGIKPELDEILKSKNEYIKYKINNNIIFSLNLKIIADILIDNIKAKSDMVYLADVKNYLRQMNKK